jgi:LemA protein
MLSGLLTFAGIVIAVVWLVISYNQLIALKHRVAKAWGNVDALLRQRHEHLLKLVETSAQYLAHDRAALDGVLDARTEVFGARHAQDVEALGRAETVLRERLAALLVLADANPDLRANPALVLLRQHIADLETQLAERREDYNDVVGENNVAIEQFPGRLIAGIGGFRAFAPLTLEPDAAGATVRALPQP